MKRLKLIARLLKLVSGFKKIILLAVINGIIGHFCAIGISIFISLAIVKYLGYNIAISYFWLFFIAISLGVLRGVLRYFEQYSNHYIAFKILHCIRHIIFEKLRQLGIINIEQRQKGDLSSQVTSDVETLEVFYAHTISPVLIALFVNGGISIFLSIFVNIYLGIAVFLIYIIIGVILPLILYKSSHRSGAIYREDLAAFNSFYLDSIAGRRDILYNQRQSDFIQNEHDITLKLQKHLVKNVKLVANTKGLVNLMIFIGCAFLLMISYFLTFNNLLNPYLVIVLVITYLSSFAPITALANLPSNLNQTFASAKRLFNLLDEKVVIDNATKEINDFNSLQLKNVNFSYTAKPILKDINISLKKGDFIAIKGPSGIGKSTILKLLMKFYPYNGSIKLNDLELSDITKESLYKSVTIFNQTTYLFNDTIRNNLLIANEDATDSDMFKALEKASLSDFILNLKDGLDTVIKEDSDNISLGEKQRLGLARVFLRKPKLLLLDEPTSNIDALNESIILNSLKKHQDDMTIILISHKESSLKIANKIYSLKDGLLYD